MALPCQRRLSRCWRTDPRTTPPPAPCWASPGDPRRGCSRRRRQARSSRELSCAWRWSPATTATAWPCARSRWRPRQRAPRPRPASSTRRQRASTSSSRCAPRGPWRTFTASRRGPSGPGLGCFAGPAHRSAAGGPHAARHAAGAVPLLGLHARGPRWGWAAAGPRLRLCNGGEADAGPCIFAEAPRPAPALGNAHGATRPHRHASVRGSTNASRGWSARAWWSWGRMASSAWRTRAVPRRRAPARSCRRLPLRAGGRSGPDAAAPRE